MQAVYDRARHATVTEIGLTVAINLAGLVFAALLARRTLGPDPGNAELRRLGSAIRRAADSLLWAGYRTTWLVAALLGIAIFIARSGWLGEKHNLEEAFFSALFVVAGVASACVTAHVAAHLSLLASLRAAAASGADSDAPITIVARTSAATALIATGLSVIPGFGVAILFFAMLGGWGATPDPDALRSVVLLSPAYALGAGAAALILQQAGTTYRVAGRAGAELGRHDGGSLDEYDARNPAMVASLVGGHVGTATTRTLDFHLAVTAGGVIAALVGVSLQSQSPTLSLTWLPFVVLAFGTIACGFGAMVVRVGRNEDPRWGLLRGHSTTTVVALGGLAGASIWLLEEQWFAFFVASSLPLMALVGLSHLSRWQLHRRLGAVREVQGAARLGTGPSLSAGLAASLQVALWPIAGVGLALVLCWRMGTASNVPQGGIVAVLTALMTLLATGPYVLAVAMFDAASDGALGVLALSPSTGGPDTSRRAQRLDETSLATGAIAQPYLIVLGGLVALSAALALPAVSTLGTPHALAVGVDLTKPLVVWSGGIGAVAVLAFAGGAIRRATRAVREVAAEVERQLRRFPRQHGVLLVPRDFVPSYRTCIELAHRHAISKIAVPVGIALVLPGLVAFAAAVLALNDPGSGQESLASLVVLVSMTGLLAALVCEGVSTALTAGRRQNRQRGGASTESYGDAIAGILGTAGAPPVQLLVKVVAAATLLVAPFV